MYFIEHCDLECQSLNPKIKSALCPTNMHAQANSGAVPSIGSEVMDKISHFYVFY